MEKKNKQQNKNVKFIYFNFIKTIEENEIIFTYIYIYIFGFFNLNPGHGLNEFATTIFDFHYKRDIVQSIFFKTELT